MGERQGETALLEHRDDLLSMLGCAAHDLGELLYQGRDHQEDEKRGDDDGADQKQGERDHARESALLHPLH